MPEETKWDVKQLEKDNNLQNKRINRLDKQVRELESFRDSTVQRLITVFNVIEELKEGDKWMKRTFTSALIVTGLAAMGSLLVWLIQT